MTYDEYLAILLIFLGVVELLWLASGQAARSPSMQWDLNAYIERRIFGTEQRNTRKKKLRLALSVLTFKAIAEIIVGFYVIVW